jgi:hypothetical protein
MISFLYGSAIICRTGCGTNINTPFPLKILSHLFMSKEDYQQDAYAEIPILHLHLHASRNSGHVKRGGNEMKSAMGGKTCNKGRLKGN